MRQRLDAIVLPKLVTGRVRRTPELTARFEAEYEESAARFSHLLRQTKAEYIDARYRLLGDK